MKALMARKTNASRNIYTSHSHKDHFSPDVLKWAAERDVHYIFSKDIRLSIFQMHCWEDYSIIEKYKRRPQVARFRDKIVDIDRDNIIFNVD